MNLLEAFIRYAPETAYNSLAHLDKHNLAKVHATLGEAVDVRMREQRIFDRRALEKIKAIPSKDDQTEAREQIDEAWLALLDEQDILDDIRRARDMFRAKARVMIELFTRREPTMDVINELEWTYDGRWCKVHHLVGLSLTIYIMRLRISWCFIPGHDVRVRIRAIDWGTRCELDPSWTKSLALATSIIEYIDLPCSIAEDDLDEFPDTPELRRCLIHNMVPARDNGKFLG